MEDRRVNSEPHDILLGAHMHDEDSFAGLEVACSCGKLLHVECDPNGFAFLSLDEILEIADNHHRS
jgi:hypothetical protein